MTALMVCAVWPVVVSTEAATIHVRKDGLGDFKTIREGFSAAKPSDTVLVYPGDYTSEGVIKPKYGVRGSSAIAMITVKAKTRRTVTVRGFNLATSATGNGAFYVRIEGFRIVASSPGGNRGVIVAGPGTQVIDNYMENNSQGVRFERRSDNAYIAYNHIYKPQYGINCPGGSRSSDNVVVEHNEIERLVRHSGVDDSDCIRAFGNEWLIRQNYFHGTRASEVGSAHFDGIQTYRSGGGLHNSVIEKNLFRNFMQGVIACSDETASSNLIIRNNVFDNSGFEKRRYGTGVLIDGGKNNIVANNLILGTYYGIRMRNANSVLGHSGVIENNIIYDVSDPLPVEMELNGEVVKIEIGHNLLYKYTYSSDAVKKKTNITGRNPLLFNTGNIVGSDGVPFTADDGYSLQAGSPAIERGAILTDSVLDDIFGTRRPQGSCYDIGPHQYALSPKLESQSSPARLRVIR